MTRALVSLNGNCAIVLFFSSDTHSWFSNVLTVSRKSASWLVVYNYASWRHRNKLNRSSAQPKITELVSLDTRFFFSLKFLFNSAQSSLDIAWRHVIMEIRFWFNFIFCNNDCLLPYQCCTKLLSERCRNGKQTFSRYFCCFSFSFKPERHSDRPERNWRTMLLQSWIKKKHHITLSHTSH